MSWIENTLARLEARMRSVIEGEQAEDGLSQQFHDQLLYVLVQAMQAGVSPSLTGSGSPGPVLIAPDQYTMIMPAEQARELLSHSSELDKLAENLSSVARNAGYTLAAPPMLRVVANPSAETVHIQVEFVQPGNRMGDSFTTKLEDIPLVQKVPSNGLMPKAFLIVNGLTTYPIAQLITNIGSNSDNQLVIKDRRVSPQHAQLRFIVNRFVLFDLDSKGGTFVNGAAIKSHVLNPGDVLLLGDVPLVFGQESPPQMGSTTELPAGPPSLEILQG